MEAKEEMDNETRKIIYSYLDAIDKVGREVMRKLPPIPPGMTPDEIKAREVKMVIDKDRVYFTQKGKVISPVIWIDVNLREKLVRMLHEIEL